MEHQAEIALALSKQGEEYFQSVVADYPDLAEKIFEAGINSLDGSGFCIAHRDCRGMAESHGSYRGGYHSVIQAEFGVAA